MADVDALPPEAREMLLKELRDLRMPEPLSWWPPAPGWWIVAALSAAALVWIAVKVARRRQATRYLRDASSALGDLHERWTTSQDNAAYLDEAAGLLRQLAIKIRGRERVAGLTGTAWIDELAGLSEATLSTDTTTALTATRYRGSSSANIGDIHDDIRQWLRQLKATPNV